MVEILIFVEGENPANPCSEKLAKLGENQQ